MTELPSGWVAPPQPQQEIIERSIEEIQQENERLRAELKQRHESDVQWLREKGQYISAMPEGAFLTAAVTQTQGDHEMVAIFAIPAKDLKRLWELASRGLDTRN